MFQGSLSSGSNRSGVYVLVVTMHKFFHLVGVSIPARQLRNMAQDIICSPGVGAKCLRLSLMAKLVLFCLAWLFPFASAFSHFSD